MPCHRTVTSGSTIAVVTLALVATPLAVANADPTPTTHLHPRWAPRSHSGLNGPASSVLATAPAHGPVRVVTVSVDDNGHPHVGVHTEADRGAARTFVDRARQQRDVVSVSVDHRLRTTATALSDDPMRASQWALTRLHAEDAWALSRGTGVTVAVVDTGVDATHPDLAGDVVPGTDLISGGNGETDPDGHGTHVAGIIAATAGNGVGVAGLAPGVKIMPVRVLDGTGSGSTATAAQGVIWAADHGAQVISMSMGGPDDDPALDAAIAYAQGKGALVVASAGNSGQPCTSTSTPGSCGDPVTFPAAVPGVIAVAATDSTDAVASFSETGAFVDLAAPGVSILSTWPGNQYRNGTGTSMAAPMVSATAAMVRAARPDLSAADVTQLLETTADDLGAPGRDDEYGYGLVDPVAALTAAGAAAPSTPSALTRVAGTNRIATAVAASQQAFADGSAGAVVLARADAYPDALAGTPLAAAHGGPLLLTGSSSLAAAALAEIRRVLPPGGTVYLLGGTAALTPAVADAVTAAGYTPVRYGGANRFDTARIIADQGLGAPATVLEATGTGFADALAAGAAAAAAHAAVLLTNGSHQSSVAAAYLSAQPGVTRYSVGGPAATADPGATPLVGSNRYATAIAVASRFFTGPTTLALASGSNFPDALSGGAAVAATGGPLLLVPADGSVPAAIASYLTGQHVTRAVLYGGTGAVSSTMAAALGAMLPV